MNLHQRDIKLMMEGEDIENHIEMYQGINLIIEIHIMEEIIGIEIGIGIIEIQDNLQQDDIMIIDPNNVHMEVEILNTNLQEDLQLDMMKNHNQISQKI